MFTRRCGARMGDGVQHDPTAPSAQLQTPAAWLQTWQAEHSNTDDTSSWKGGCNGGTEPIHALAPDAGGSYRHRPQGETHGGVTSTPAPVRSNGCVSLHDVRDHRLGNQPLD